MEIENYESCVKFNISSARCNLKAKRDLFLTAHFQEAQYPPRRTGEKPLFNYSITDTVLSINLHNSSMPIECIEPIIQFDLYYDSNLKKTELGEIGGSGEISYKKNISPEPKDEVSGRLQAVTKKSKTTSTEYSDRKYTTELIHASDKELHLCFSDKHKPLIGTLKSRLLGRVDYSSGGKVKAKLRVFEKDINSKPNEDMILKGLRGFVAFKYHRRSIAREITKKSSVEVSL